MIRFNVASETTSMRVSDSKATMKVDNAILVAGAGGGGGSGNVSSDDISRIRVLDLAEYNEINLKDSETLYFVRG